ncbi:uncharacterized protein N7469_000883 [Penicillium citrinum]|uniref:Uncharacterized protein n=1 Tax=Penicillium citrinum TaxID=5077 RepID=A0A9W9PDQ5_PENCI|nr:uncharacterized protein N7469_000883 [Penicillium citrinum]KAJ5242556.1 hypothetical protein N7469_000883 [Penicillium citrinum]KAK5806794.1 hypothetical protein VI817_001052 [Penicillium citrinum]
MATTSHLQPPQSPKQQLPYSSESSILPTSDSPSQYSSFSSSDSDPDPENDGDADNDVDENSLGATNLVNEDDADDVVGVSIGRFQSRMKARATPAEEKSRILEQQGGYFSTVPDTVGEDGLFTSEITAEPESLDPKEIAHKAEFEQQQQQLKNQRATARKPATHPPLPSSSAAPFIPSDHQFPRGPHKESSAPVGYSTDSKDANQRSSFTRSILKTSLPRRPRAWSGELKKFLPDLGSLTKRPSLSFRSHNAPRARSQTVVGATKRSPEIGSTTSSPDRHSPPSSPSQMPNGNNTNGALNTSVNGHRANGSEEEEGDDSLPLTELRSVDGASAAKHSFARRPSATPKRPPSLRRSSSDQSLYLRASSTASSLEQRPLYENVHSQVNSRFKAIKDSLQDSSSRLLSMPSLHLQDIRYDWSSRPSFFNENGTAEPHTLDKGMNGPSAHPAAAPPPPPKAHSQSTHPILEEAMSELTGDVVILGGYRGSILRSAKPPHRQLWVPMKVGLNLRKVDLEVGLTREDEERMEESIIPSGVLSHVGPVDVCRRLMKRLRKCENAVRGDLRVWDYGYDWRLSPELLSDRLIAFLERLPSNRPSMDGSTKSNRGATVIAHSLGGLITRHAVNKRPDLFAGVLYAGVPQHCVNILGPLRNGDDVLLSSRVLTAQVNFTFRTSFALLPEDGHCFIDKQSKEEFRVDFFNADNWEEYRLSPCMGPALPPPNAGSVFKDFATISKRFSLGPRDSQNFNLQEFQELNDPNASSTKEIDPHNSSRHARPISVPNPSALAESAHDKANDALHPSLEGIVGPSAPRGSSSTNKTSTTCTIPRAVAAEYLQRTLSEVKSFKQDLEFKPSHQSENKYPPAAVLYGKSVPTVYGARVTSREAIKQQDCYDDLAFAAGDGVCLASAAMLPPGYRIIKNGLVKSDRGHVGLLGDLEGVGQCLRAIVRGRREGVGLGTTSAVAV